MSSEAKLKETLGGLSKTLEQVKGLQGKIEGITKSIEVADCKLFGRQAKVGITQSGKIMIDFCDKKGTKEDLQKIVDQCQ